MGFGVVDETGVQITHARRGAMFAGEFAVAVKEMIFVEDQIEILDRLGEKERLHSVVQLMIFDVFQLKTNLEQIQERARGTDRGVATTGFAGRLDGIEDVGSHEEKGVVMRSLVEIHQ